MSDAERRFTSVRVEVRAGSDKRTIGGYAAKFNTLSQNLGGFKEQIAPGAFSRSRSKGWPDVIARYNHDDNMLLGTTAAGTLRMDMDKVGLTYDVDLPESRSDVHELVQRGDVGRSSFAFVVDEEDWATDDTGFPLRTLLQVDLIDVAPVNTPAYTDTSVGLRSLAAKFDAPLEEVRALAAADELVKFFRRTDEPAVEPKRSPQAALTRIMQLTS